jgi:hypothetical protein
MVSTSKIMLAIGSKLLKFADHKDQLAKMFEQIFEFHIPSYITVDYDIRKESTK